MVATVTEIATTDALARAHAADAAVRRTIDALLAKTGLTNSIGLTGYDRFLGLETAGNGQVTGPQLKALFLAEPSAPAPWCAGSSTACTRHRPHPLRLLPPIAPPSTHRHRAPQKVKALSHSTELPAPRRRRNGADRPRLHTGCVGRSAPAARRAGGGRLRTGTRPGVADSGPGGRDPADGRRAETAGWRTGESQARSVNR